MGLFRKSRSKARRCPSCDAEADTAQWEPVSSDAGAQTLRCPSCGAHIRWPADAPPEIVGTARRAPADTPEDLSDEHLMLLAAQEGEIEGVRGLLRSGVNLEAADPVGLRALHYAALKARDEVIRLLLDEGAEINSACGMGNTPLHVASWQGHPSTVRLLLERGANPNLRLTDSGWTPLRMARHRGHAEVATILAAATAVE